MAKTNYTIGFIIAALIVVILTNSSAQETKQIPVYPGANLVTETEAGSEPQCCSFTTHDSFDKVLSFYQSALKTKPMDTKQLAAAYPAMKQLFQGLEKQMPSTMKYRAFVLSEMEMGGQKSAMLFEVISNPGVVNFTIPENSVAQKDAHIVSQWREQTGQLTAEEKAGKSVADWQQLQGALPTAATVGKFKRGEVTGETSREGPTPHSSVVVSYVEQVRQGPGGEFSQKASGATIIIIIDDVGKNEDLVTEMSSPSRSSEKATTVKGRYPGKESSEGEAGHEFCEKVFHINKRVVVVCKGEGTKDLALINKLIDGMNLDKLAGLK